MPSYELPDGVTRFGFDQRVFTVMHDGPYINLADLDAIRSQERQRVRDEVEGLERFGIREDPEHPGFSEIGPVSGAAFLRREQVLAAVDSLEDD